MSNKPSHVSLVWCDNLSTVFSLVNPILHSLTKHMELDFYFVSEKVIEKKLQVHHVLSLDQTTNILTKAISASHFH